MARSLANAVSGSLRSLQHSRWLRGGCEVAARWLQGRWREVEDDAAGEQAWDCIKEWLTPVQASRDRPVTS